MAQWSRIHPPMQEMWVRSLGPEDPLEEEMATHSVFSPGNSMDRGAWWATVYGVAKSLMTEHTCTDNNRNLKIIDMLGYWNYEQLSSNCFPYSCYNICATGNSLVVQLLGLHVLTAEEGLGLIPGWRNKIPQAAWSSKKKLCSQWK